MSKDKIRNLTSDAFSDKEVPLPKKIKLVEPPPSYGTQDYWDSRYKSFLAPLPPTEGNDALPNHAWYFTYSDLRPLLLPLILGDQVADILDDEILENELDPTESNQDDDETYGEQDDEHDGDQDEENDEAQNEDQEEEENMANLNGRRILNCNSSLDEANGKEGKEAEQNSGNEEVKLGEEGRLGEEAKDGDDGGCDDFEGGSIDIDYDEDDQDDEPNARIGVSKDGPASILEIGCGDVPLGTDLVMQLMLLSKKGHFDLDQVFKKVICCDFSSTVISMLKSQKFEFNGMSDLDQEYLGKIVEFQEVDARSMSQFQDSSFQIVMDKGTLDAMLSDKLNGIKYCQDITAEMARVLTIGGYIFIVSHLNANFQNGLDWLHEVIFSGLKAAGKGVSWEIEVHGNDVPISSDGKDDNPGPCVYIIEKQQSQSNDDEIPITLKFLTY
jgi:SAM-dependent methyltransferase